ncbi:unnamed protein product [Paramecium sonneborni]|uniref:Uncharacterized protein n=1 Tax=Paramecium sonneborni TaxID=65129 RepID=A0A8S1RTB2_9CILI|nr:unnamed protein product [Paramecium sonneborni]
MLYQNMVDKVNTQLDLFIITQIYFQVKFQLELLLRTLQYFTNSDKAKFISFLSNCQVPPQQEYQISLLDKLCN